MSAIAQQSRTALSPMPLLVVASMYPAFDDAGRGRFVADQVEALLATGAAQPWVISFELARCSGDPAWREGQRQAVLRRSQAALATSQRVLTPRGWAGPADVPVARLQVPVGTGVEGDDHAAAVAALMERLTGPGLTGGSIPVLHAHGGFPDGYAAAATAARHGWPLVITEHYSRVDRQLERPDVAQRYRQAVAAAARVVAVSGMQARTLAALVPETAEKTIVVPNTVDVAHFSPPAPGERRSDELLYVGYRKPDKGIRLLLAAFARARRERQDLRLRLIGGQHSEAEEADLRRLAAESGVAEAVSFEPPADRAAVAQAMRRATLFVHPSKLETFGMVAAEALASGLPVVATDSGGVTEILGGPEEGLGIVVPSHAPDALAAGILDALGSRERFDPLALRRSVEERFGAPAVAARLVELYGEVLDERRAGEPTPVAADAWASLMSAERRSPAVLVALARTRAAEELEALHDAGLDGRLRALTARDPAHVELPAGATSRGGVVEVDLEADYRRALAAVGGTQRPADPLSRLVRLLRDPAAARERRRLTRERTESRLRSAAAALAAVVSDRDGAETVALDGLDHLTLEAAGLPAEAPGGLRWLTDGWAAADDLDGGPGQPRASRSTSAT